MMLRSLELKQFGKFTDFSVEFRKGMNLVAGANEAGKTTLMEAIPAILFGVRNKERFRPWGRSGECVAAVVFEVGQHSVRIERDLLSDKVTLIESDDLYQTLYSFEGKVAPMGRSADRAEYQQQLLRLFGIADEDLFRTSLFFGQGSLELLDHGGLAARIKAILSGFVEVDYDQVLQSLQDDYFLLTRENPWGKDKAKERALDEVRTQLATLEERWHAARSGLQQQEVFNAEQRELEQSLERDRADHEKGVRYLDWVRRQWQLEEKEVGLKRDFDRVQRVTGKVDGLAAERQELLRELVKTGIPRVFPDDLPYLLSDAEKIRRQLLALQSGALPLRKALHALPAPPWQPCILLSLFLLGGVTIFGWRFPDRLGGALLLGGMLLLSAWGVAIWRALQLRSDRSRLLEQLRSVEQRREEAQDGLEEFDQRFRQLGMSPSAVEIAKMQKNLERHRQLVVRLVEVESALGVLEQPAELVSEQRQLTRELVVVSERLEQDRPLRPDLLARDELPEAEAKLAVLGERIRTQEQQLFALTRRQATLQGELVDLQQIEDEGERLREAELALTHRKEALAIAYDLLRATVADYRQQHIEQFSAEIGQHLAAITHGRYTALRLSEGFAIELAGRSDRWHPLEVFSRGTIDAVYFAARLALTKHLAGGHLLPLFLDDPLVNFDKGRLAETLRLLERLCSDHQIILFSHSEQLQKRAARDRWHVVVLDEARASQPPLRNDERNDDGGQLYLL